MGAQIRGTFVQIFGDLQAFLGHILLQGLNQAYGPMLKALLLLCYLFCGHVGPLGCFFSAPFDLAGGLLRTVRKTR